MPKLKVLMADDEPDILNIMAKKVAREGFDVFKAVDGEEAWALFQKELPDIILLDLTMPKMDGLQVLTKIRATTLSEKWHPVIIVSARAELVDLQQGYALEADHYITKPCHVEDVVKAVRLMESLIPQRKKQEDGSE